MIIIQCCEYYLNFYFYNQLITQGMIVKSNFFKKQFDVSKAELIGEGNFAQVYRVFDPETQTYLAIRRVDRDLGEKQDIEKQKTINEQLRRVENQHILKIFDIIESETCIWYITQYCQGGSLWDALNNCQDNKMNEKDALECIYQISKGVKELHNYRITHRDLKPENILLKNKYVPNKPIPAIKIADFGLSTKKIIMQTIAGTKQYIAPEQARFHNYTNAVDVWSLGIIFDQILHGSPFYVGDNNKQVFQKILKNPYKVRDESIRPSIQQFLTSVLKKKAYERPIIAVICQSIQKIIDELKKQKGQTQEKPEKPQKPERPNLYLSSFQKKNIRSLQNVYMQQTKPVNMVSNPNISYDQNSSDKELTNRDMTPVVVSTREIGQGDKYGMGTPNQDKSSAKRQERKAKTPFKRQNGRPQFFKPSDELQQVPTPTNANRERKVLITNKKQPEPKVISRDVSKQLAKQPTLQTPKQTKQTKQTPKYSREITRQLSRQVSRQQTLKQNKQFFKQNLPKDPSSTTVLTEPSQRQQTASSIDAQKINVYRVDKRKIQSLPSKQRELSPKIIDIKQYMEGVIKTKNDLIQNSLFAMAKEREFLINSQLTVTDFPNKFEGQQTMKKFKRNYQFLNHINYNQDYQIKLYSGKNSLSENRAKAEQEMREQKQKIKKIFLTQIDKYVDYYIQKALK